MKNPTPVKHDLFRPAARRAFASGQSMVEYVLICGVIAFVLGVSVIDRSSMLWQLIDSFQSRYQHYSFAISLPT